MYRLNDPEIRRRKMLDDIREKLINYNNRKMKNYNRIRRNFNFRDFLICVFMCCSESVILFSFIINNFIVFKMFIFLILKKNERKFYSKILMIMF